jgi:ABC-type nitrate/sulfonate/bicarbonate transport system substrate-binding protein
MMITRMQAIWILENLPREPITVVANAEEWRQQRKEAVQALQEVVAAGDYFSDSESKPCDLSLTKGS